MTATEGSAGSNTTTPPASQMTSQQAPESDLESVGSDSEHLDEFAENSLADAEPETLELDDDADVESVYHEETDPDVAAVDSAMSASRKQRLADKNSNIRRLLEERSDERRLQQDLDYLDFDD